MEHQYAVDSGVSSTTPAQRRATIRGAPALSTSRHVPRRLSHSGSEAPAAAGMMVACRGGTGHTAGHYHSGPPSARPGSFAEEGTMRRLHTLFQDGSEEAATASRR